MMDLLQIAHTLITLDVPLWTMLGMAAFFGFLLYAVDQDALTQERARRIMMAVVEAFDEGEASIGDMMKRGVAEVTKNEPARMRDALRRFEEGKRIGPAKLKELEEIITRDAEIISARDQKERPSTVRRIGNAVLRVAPIVLTTILKR